METFSEKLVIDDSWSYGCNRCLVCDNYYKHSRIWWGENTEDAERGIFALKEKVSHHECQKIVNDIKKKKQELLDLEYKLFEKQFLREFPVA
jgi:hypothetical protein